jgi:hydroxymethylpyrimidine/phosphomethylpyrimidine kinase
MVAQLATIDAIAAGLTRWSPKHVVLDPVMVATSGDRLLAAEAVEALRTKLIPRASLITPNLPEAAACWTSRSRASEPPSRARASGCSRWDAARC